MNLLGNFLKIFASPAAPASPPSAAGQSTRQTVRHARVASSRQPVAEVAQVFDLNGVQQDLAEPLARGGEGTVHPLRARPEVVVKLYHPHVLAQCAELGTKIATMRVMSEFVRDEGFAWPRVDVFDAQRRWLGYGMRRVAGLSFQNLCQPALVRERLPHWDRRHLVRVARDFIEKLDALHKRGIIVGDINPGNFLVDPDTCAVRFIDCDSYQVRNGQLFLCRVAIPDFMAPEIVDSFGSTERTVEHELFSVAVMLFKLLMFGLHPYSHRNGSDPISNLRKGMSPLGRGAQCLFPVGPWYTIWSHLPYKLKSLFIRTFRDGYREPAQRASLGEWRAELGSYAYQLDNGIQSLELFPATPKTDEYLGKGAVPHPSESRAPGSRRKVSAAPEIRCRRALSTSG